MFHTLISGNRAINFTAFMQVLLAIYKDFAVQVQKPVSNLKNPWKKISTKNLYYVKDCIHNILINN
jgi:hypothetical protein